MPYFCGSRPSLSLNSSTSCLVSEPRAPSAKNVYLPRSSMPRTKLSVGCAVAADAHVAGGDADDGAVLVVEHLAGGKARIDLDAELGRLLAEPDAQRPEADDVVAVIAHQRRHEDGGQPDRAGLGEEIEAVVLHRRLDRRALLLPVGNEAVEALGVDDGAGEDVRADGRALFDDDDRQLAPGFRRRAASGGSPPPDRPARRRR